jgi:hypothetical protein
MGMGFFPLYKGVTTSFKPIYKRCGQQREANFCSLFSEGATTFVNFN